MKNKYNSAFRANVIASLEHMTDREAAAAAGIALSTLHEFKAKAGLVKPYVRKRRAGPAFIPRPRLRAILPREFDMLDDETEMSMRPLIARTLDDIGVPRHCIREILE